MKTLLNRTITVNGRQITRNVTVKGEKATIRHKNQIKEVTPAGNYLDKQTVWTVKVA